MKLSSPDLTELADLAVLAATEAGHMIAESRPVEVRHKANATSLASQVVTEIDRRSEDIIVGHLMPTLERFKLGLLTEERQDDRSRLTAEYFWCIDPLDGTLPFVEGRPGYAVSIALVDRNGTPHIGVVHDPVEQTLWRASVGGGAFCDGQPLSIQTSTTTAADRSEVLAVFADRSFLASDNHDAVIEALEQIAQELGLAGVELDATGGAVINACRVLRHAPACYFKFPKSAGGGSVWDFAATACLFQEAGAVAADMFGGALELNRAESTFMHHRGVLFSTDETLAKQIRTLWLSND